MVVLISSENEQFVVDKEIIKSRVLVGSMLEDFGDSDEPLPLHNVSSSVLKKILEYCEHHRGDPLSTADDVDKRTTDIGEWDRIFITVDPEMLFEIVLAANFLNIKPLQELGCGVVAGMIKGKSPEEIRKIFNIVNTFTPEEEVATREEVESAEDR